MQIAATAFGLDARITYLPSAGDDDLMATVHLIHNEISPDPLNDAIWRRQTNRKFYEKRALPSPVLRDLHECMSDFSGVTLHFITAPHDLRQVAKMVFKVDRIRTEHRPLHEHLCKMVRYSQEDAAGKQDGLPLKNLEAGLAGEIFLKATRPWWVMNLANKVGLGKMVALHAYQGIVNSSGVALLTVNGTETKDFLSGGQALERIWLTITQKGLAMQPMTAITLFWLRWQMEGIDRFAKPHRKLLRDVWQQYRELFPEVDFSKDGHVMLFRIGYGKEISYRTYRKDIDSFLL
jgi:hypothetical protein